jgi:hypothetical protein
MFLLAVSLVPGKVQAQAWASAGRSTQVPAAVYSRLFREVVDLQARADRLAANGQPSASIRHRQLRLGLTSEQETQLKQVATDWAQQCAPLDVEAASARTELQRLRRESSGAAVAAQAADLRGIAALQVALAQSGRDALAGAFGSEAFASFESALKGYRPHPDPMLGAAKIQRMEPHDCSGSNPAPTYMIILTDKTGLCSGCTSTAERDFTYQVMVSPGQPWSGPTGTGGAMCETNQVTGWNCAQSAPVETSSCGNPDLFVWAGTNGVMPGYDAWSFFSDSFSPAGCGWNTSDLWNALAGTQVGVGGMSGYIHTNAIKVNGSVSTPSTQGTLAGTCMNASGATTCPH